jgi:RHH-type proline utilization regulon transcriptional repressor/proline dehydrogenase/delta 1-pyrroline-5-carboxylate dehydrogenase
LGPLPRANVSVKLSSLSPDFSHDIPKLDLDEVYRRLAVICRAARKHAVFINIDLEHDSLRAATFEISKRLLSEPDLRDWPDAGVVIQAYLRDSRRDLDDLFAFTRRRGVPIAVRLVKGAYWDYETARAAKENRPSPVWSQKWQSDANYEEISRILIEHCDQLRPAFGSHNVRAPSNSRPSSAWATP